MLPARTKNSYVPDIMDHFFGNHFLSSLFSDGADYTAPAVNIKESEKGFEIEVAAPGLNKDDFSISLDKGLLTVSSETKKENNDESDNYMRKEFSFSTFRRSFSLPDSVDMDKIKARHENGILSIALPKIDEAKANKLKTIKIS